MKKNNHYEVYHIIEMTDDQQTAEVIAQSTDDAIGKYLFHFSIDPWNSVTKAGSNIVVDFPKEVCIIWERTSNLIYAKWISKLGLY